MESARTSYSEMFKRQVVAELEAGVVTASAARAKYGIQGHSTILKWTRKYGSGEPRGSRGPATGGQTEDDALRLRHENRLLKQELDHARMRTVVLETLVDLAEQTYKVPIRKNCGAKQSFS